LNNNTVGRSGPIIYCDDVSTINWPVHQSAFSCHTLLPVYFNPKKRPSREKKDPYIYIYVYEIKGRTQKRREIIE